MINISSASIDSHENFIQALINQSKQNHEIEQELTAKPYVMTVVTILKIAAANKRTMVLALISMELKIEKSSCN